MLREGKLKPDDTNPFSQCRVVDQSLFSKKR